MAHLILQKLDIQPEIAPAVHQLYWFECLPESGPTRLRFLPNGYPNGFIPLGGYNLQNGCPPAAYCALQHHFSPGLDFLFQGGERFLWVKWQPWSLGMLGEKPFRGGWSIPAEQDADPAFIAAEFARQVVAAIVGRPKDSEVEGMVQRIFHSKGREKVQEIVKDAHIGLRRLEQKFQQKVGVSPKQLSRDVRMRHLAEAIQQQGDGDLLGLAVDHGFFDQAHFIREVRHYTQETPRQFARSLLNRTLLYDLHLAV